MKTINYKEDYFNTLLSGEGQTISWAEAVSVHALRDSAPEGHTLLLRFDETDSEGNPDTDLFSLYDIQSSPALRSPSSGGLPSSSKALTVPFPFRIWRLSQG